MDNNEAWVLVVFILMVGILIYLLKDLLFQLAIIAIMFGGSMSFAWFKAKGK